MQKFFLKFVVQYYFKKTLNRHTHMLIEGKAYWWYLRGRTLNEKKNNSRDLNIHRTFLVDSVLTSPTQDY